MIREDEVEVAGDASTLISFLGFRKRGASVDETHETVGATMGQYSTHMASKIARAPVGGHGGSHGRESAEKVCCRWNIRFKSSGYSMCREKARLSTEGLHSMPAKDTVSTCFLPDARDSFFTIGESHVSTE